MNRVTVELGERSYDILIGSGLLETAPGLLADSGVGRRVFVVSDGRVHDLYGGLLEDRLRTAGCEVARLALPEGETAKTLATVESLYAELIERRADRHSTVLALGGGVTGDVAGFAAATYLRGIPLVQLPTTLLAQVDSSVGGKTGVNHQRAKNLIGAFHQPVLVIADTDTLASLPDRDYRSGLYEVAKYGLIYDAGFFRFFGENLEALLAREAAVLQVVVSRCCEIKAAVISADEREQGMRRILNFGHTLGHALEAAVAYDGITHGEAVGYGMLGALRLSQARDLLDEATVHRISETLLAVGPLPDAGKIPFGRLCEAMEHDKKRRDGQTRFVLLNGVGSTVVEEDLDLALVAEAWESAVVAAERQRS